MFWPDSFDHPLRLLLLLAVAGLAVAVAVRATHRQSVERRWSAQALAASVAPRRPGWSRRLSALLVLSALVPLTVAFAGPREVREVQRERATVVVALDTSASMLARDVAPDRFTAAQAAATRFVDGLPDSFDVALVSFAGTAALRVAPTGNHRAVTDAIARLQLAGGTALGDAVLTSLSALRGPGGQAVGAVVVLADGGNTTGSPLPRAVAQAADAGVQISTIAFGTPAGEAESAGRIVPVPVDTATLAGLAADTGGRAYAAETAGELREAYDSIGTRLSTTSENQDVAAPLVGLALALLLAGAAPALLRR